jgi:hypothetical protein
MSYSDMDSSSSASTPGVNGVPVGGGGREPPKSRVSEIITLLIDEISQGIKNISSLPKLKVIREIEQIREESFRASRAPEAEFALKLFRKYADVAHSYKVKCDNAEKGPTNAGEVIVPSYLYETTMEPVAGFGALNHNKFWLRAATCLFCFLCYVIMGTTPNIQFAYVYPSSVFRVRLND